VKVPSESRLHVRVLNDLRHHGSRAVLILVGLSWLLVISVGVSVLWSFENTAGAAASAPRQWPSASRLAPPHGRSALVVLLHPQCACSRATVAELARLMTRVHGRVDVRVLVLSESGMGDSWSKSDLWYDAGAIPGVTVVADEGGLEARHFGTATSGEALLYDAAGRLQFSGGITRSRGHEGDNTGRSALETILSGGNAPRSSTSVFGCPLFASTERTDAANTP
jgi:hypothetical protein